MEASTPLKSDIIGWLRAFVARHDIAPGAPLALAVSGGGDSVALLLACAEVFPRDQITVLTVDHRLRAESAQEVRWVADRCADLGLGHHILRWEQSPEDQSRGNVQARARAARYALLADFCAARDLPYLLTAHHADDAAETVLLRLARGSGVDGLALMQDRVTLDAVGPKGPILLRPFLDIPRDDVRAWAKARGATWLEDPSNGDARYNRVRVRTLLAGAEIEGLNRDRLLETGKAMRRAQEALDALADQWEVTAFQWLSAELLEIDLGRLQQAPEETRLRLWARALAMIGGGPYRPRLDALAAMMAAVAAGSVRTLSGVVIWSEAETKALLTREERARPIAGGLKAGDCYDSRYRLMRSLDKDEKLAPLGERGWQSLVARGDDVPWRGYPHRVRTTLPALWRGQGGAAADVIDDADILIGVAVHPNTGLGEENGVDQGPDSRAKPDDGPVVCVYLSKK